jgi:DNA-binding transcriptional LysR family regulator
LSDFVPLPRWWRPSSQTASNVRSISDSYDQIGEHILAGARISRLPLDPRLFEWAPLGSARNVCIFRPDHRFSQQTCIEAHDLAGETIVDVDPQFVAHQMNFNALRFAGVEPDILVEFDAKVTKPDTFRLAWAFR